MRIAFCDDEPDIRAILENYLKTYFEQKEMQQPEYISFSSGETLLEEKGDIDIVFLDVKMAGIDGIETGRKLREKNPEMIIFMETSFLEYLDDAMRFHVFRYLTKPIEQDRLFRNMDDALEQYMKNQRSFQKIQVKTSEGVCAISISSIIYIEAMGHRTHIYTSQQEYSARETLEFWISQLDSNIFFQTHRSFLVNMDYVTGVSANSVSLCDGKYSVFLTAKRRKAFKEAYRTLLENI